MKHTNKVIIDMSTAYDGIEFQYQFEERTNHFISKFKTKIIKIEVNDIEILPDLQQLKSLLLSMNKNQIIKSKIFIESEYSKRDIETSNLLAKIFKRPELKIESEKK